MAKHLKATAFIKAGIFDQLKNFSELEKRISSLPLEKDRGAAFEVFAEAYLATQPLCQVKEVWPQNSAPSQLLKNLALPISKDMGTDGLVELKDGRVASYQAKFYTGRPSLNWSILSTFFAISDRVSHTIIFTNSDTLASTVERRRNFTQGMLVYGDIPRMDLELFPGAVGLCLITGAAVWSQARSVFFRYFSTAAAMAAFLTELRLAALARTTASIMMAWFRFFSAMRECAPRRGGLTSRRMRRLPGAARGTAPAIVL